MDDPGEPPQAIPTGRPGAPIGLNDPRALTILTTEHWNLLTARSLVYNEAFARSGMFLSFLSATLVVLGLLATGGFSDAFLAIVAVVLGVDLFVGLATLGRILDASREDLRYLQGMNRLRHAYFEIVPGLDPYFVTSAHDDINSIIALYGTSKPTGPVGDLLHGFTTTPGMIGAIVSAIAGALIATLVVLMTHNPTSGALAGVAAFLAFFVLLTVAIARRVVGYLRNVDVRFPGPSEPG